MPSNDIPPPDTMPNLLRHAAEELTHIFVLAIKHEVTATEIRDFVYGFPTFSADIKSML